MIEKRDIKNDETIFQNLNRKPIDHDNFRRIFTRDLKAFNGKMIRMHDLRHTAATLLISSGVDLKTVQSILGHEDIKTTMNYVHLLGDSVAKVAMSFEIMPTKVPILKAVEHM